MMKKADAHAHRGAIADVGDALVGGTLCIEDESRTTHDKPHQSLQGVQHDQVDGETLGYIQHAGTQAEQHQSPTKSHARPSIVFRSVRAISQFFVA